MKRLLSLLLSFAITVSLISPALAASDEATAAANALYELWLFNGTGTDASGKPIFDLDRAPTRHEAVTMLVRLLGKESEAKAGSWSIPFMDVAEWAIPYVGYAYTNGLTTGTSDTTFGGNDIVTASQYLTLVLRSLGYESGTDFQWDKAWELSDSIGLTDGRYNAGTSSFTRGDVATISHWALQTPCKQTAITLLQSLINSGIIPQKIENVQKNNIPLEEIENIVKPYVGATALIGGMTEIMKKIVEEQRPATSTQIGAFCVMAGGMIKEFENMYNSCGSYDDTVNLKKYLYDIKIAFQELSGITSRDIATNTFSENNAYFDEFKDIYNSLLDNETFDMVAEEMHPFLEIYQNSMGGE